MLQCGNRLNKHIQSSPNYFPHCIFFLRVVVEMTTSNNAQPIRLAESEGA